MKPRGQRSGNPKKPRLPWWNPEGVIEKMRETGLGISQVANLAAQECPEGPVAQVLKMETLAWRRKYPEFVQAYAELYHSKVAHGDVPAPRPSIDTPEVRLKFLETFAEEALRTDDPGTSPLTRACQRSGISRSWVMARRDPNGPRYDPEFAAAVSELEGERLAAIRDKFYFHAEVGTDGLGNPWVQQKILSSGLPYLHAERYEQKVVQEATVTPVHKLDAETLAAIQAQTRALMALPSAEERAVIDLTPRPMEFPRGNPAPEEPEEWAEL